MASNKNTYNKILEKAATNWGMLTLAAAIFGMGFTVALFINHRSKNIEMNDRQIEYYNSIKERDNIIIDLKGELMILKIQIENKKENTKNENK